MRWLGSMVTILVIAPAIARAEDLPIADPEPASATVAAPPDAPPPPPEPLSLADESRKAAQAGHCERARGFAVLAREDDPTGYDALAGELVKLGCLQGPPIEVPVAATRPSTKSATTALLLSLTPTVIGLGLGITAIALSQESGCQGSITDPVCKDYNGIAAGLGIVGGLAVAVGPTLGHVYAGRAWNRGLAIRLIGVGVAAIGVIGIASETHRCRGICAAEGVGGLHIVGGGVTFLIGAAIEIAKAPGAARRPIRVGPQVSIAPIRTRHGTAPALMLSATF